MAAVDLLAMHADLTRVIQAHGRDSAIGARARALRGLVARLALAEPERLLAGADPVEGVRRAALLAWQAGADWDRVVAAIETAALTRHAS